jgi:hypothetical protein
MSGTLRVDAIEGHLELLCILLHCFLDTLLEIAVYIVPAIGLFGQIVFVPSWYIPFNEIKPEFGILFHDMRRKQFERSEFLGALDFKKERTSKRIGDIANIVQIFDVPNGSRGAKL